MSEILRKNQLTPNSIYAPFDTFVARMPLMPVEFYTELSKYGLVDPSSKLGKEYPELAMMSGSSVPKSKKIRLAIMLASPELFHGLGKDGTRDARSFKKMIRYLLRMSTRPTPYGMFAGVCVGKWAATAKVTFQRRGTRIRARPDMGWLMPVISKLESDQEVLKHLLLISNQSLVEFGNRIFATEDSSISDSNTLEKVSIRATDAIKELVSITQQGISYGALVDRLAKRYGSSREIVEKVILDLVGRSILITSLRPRITDQNPLEQVLDALSSTKNETTKELAMLDRQIKKLNGLIGDPEESIHEISETVNRLFGKTYNPPLQVDTAFSLNGLALPKDVGATAARAAELLLITSQYSGGGPLIADYKNKFIEKYGEWREVPVLELMDQNIGIGSPYAKRDRPSKNAELENETKRIGMLMDLAYEAILKGDNVVKLGPDLIKRLTEWKPKGMKLPNTLDIFVSVSAKSRSDIKHGKFKVFISPIIGVLGAGSGISRFSDIIKEECSKMFEDISKAEKKAHSDEIIAEIVVPPRQIRLMDVAMRNRIYDYEIPLGVRSSVDRSRTIPLNEIVVGVMGGNFYLKWAKIGKRIIARSSSMINPHLLPDTMRLLLDISSEGQVQLAPFIPDRMQNMAYLPRFEVENIVLSPAQWALSDVIIARELDMTSMSSFLSSFRRFRESWRVPRFVYIKSGDNRLFLDLENREQAEQLYLELKAVKKGTVVIQEAPEPYDEALLSIRGKHYFGELVVPLVLKEEAPPVKNETFTAKIAKVSIIDRMKPPSSEWLYAELQMHSELADDLLRNQINAFCHETLKRKLAKDWFFIRYEDPNFHLRLRFNGKDTVLTDKLMPELSRFGAMLLETKLISRFSIETYDREIERYGGLEGLAISEEVFCIDSKVAIKLIPSPTAASAEFDKIVATALTADMMISCLGVKADDRLQMYKRWTSGLRHLPDKDFRTRLTKLSDMVAESYWPPSRECAMPELRDVIEIMKKLPALGKKLAKLQDENKLSNTIVNIYDSMVHMHCNRILGIDQDAEASTRIMMKRALEILLAKPA